MLPLDRQPPALSSIHTTMSLPISTSAISLQSLTAISRPSFPSRDYQTK